MAVDLGLDLTDLAQDDLRLIRPSPELLFSQIAQLVATRGSCRRRRVGAVLVRDHDRRILSTGYNGAPRGMPDCLQVGCDIREINGKKSCVRTLHAESNALDLVEPSTEDRTLYITVTPCRDCALRIIQHGIKRVIYAEFYSSRSTLDVFDLFANQADVERLRADPMFMKSSPDFRGKYEALYRRVAVYQIDLATGALRPGVSPVK
jgi:dCMP deaminase